METEAEVRVWHSQPRVSRLASEALGLGAAKAGQRGPRVRERSRLVSKALGSGSSQGWSARPRGLGAAKAGQQGPGVWEQPGTHSFQWEHSPAALSLDLWPPELWEDTFLLLKLPSSWFFVTAAPRNSHRGAANEQLSVHCGPLGIRDVCFYPRFSLHYAHTEGTFFL